MNSLAILWAQYGPYHIARASALKQLAAPAKVHALEFANRSSDYAWRRNAQTIELITLCPDRVSEQLSFRSVFNHTRQRLKELCVQVCLMPSYSPLQPFAALLAAKSLGIKTVMMNESHAGTARAGVAGSSIKRRLVGMFDAALVGGRPQKRYFASLGMAEDKIFTGYDAVDNDYFARRAEEIRTQVSEIRRKYKLPEHYFLSLGRFVAKKNLGTLIRAFRKFLDSQANVDTHLVMVGSGAEESQLRALCREFCLPIYDKTEAAVGNRKLEIGNELPGVHFYGFRQIDENPVFYALADAFILPSLFEEWGLVVNEAMASGLPVVVSQTAGCAEDLLESSSQKLDWRLDANHCPPETIERSVRRNGFVFEPRSADELAAILQILESQKELRLTMGAASREIVEKFSCEHFAENALRAAEAALAGAPGRELFTTKIPQSF